MQDLPIRTPARRPLAWGFVALLVATAVLPMVAAKTWNAPYGDAEASATGSGCRLTDAKHDRMSGKLHAYGSACGVGSSTAVARTGTTFTLFSGDLLGSFSDSASTETYQKGHLQCLSYNFIGDLRSSYEVKIQKWRRVGATWNLEQENVVSNVDCSPFGGITSIDRTVRGSGFFTFNPGETYRITTQATSKASGIGAGSASADFYSHSWPDDERTTVHYITLPNQAPKALSNDRSALYLLESISGSSTVSGRGCDIDSGTTRVRVQIDGQSSYGESAGSAMGCRTATKAYSPALLPGSYGMVTTVTDAEGATASDRGTYRSEVLPGLLTSVSGFPDLSQISESSLGSAVTVELLTNSAGQIRAYRVASDGTVFMNTMGSVMPAPGDVVGAIEYNRVLSIADVKKSGVSQWSGLVMEASADAPWWNIIPVNQVEPSTTPNPTVAPNVDFTALETVPYRELVPETESAHDEGN